jgi:hypothetical protein
VSDYCEWPEFYYETFPRARKEYRCCECKSPIVKGEEHLHYRGKWDGELGTGRQHLLCRKACMYIRDAFQGGECIGFGQLAEYWQEYAKGWWTPERKADPKLAAFRGLMAGVLWRERFHGKRSAFR